MGERDEDSKGKAGKERHDDVIFLSQKRGQPRSEEKCRTKILVNSAARGGGLSHKSAV